MRFEIKSGGVAAILVGIAALSGAVFMLGLLAGYDVGRESQSSAAQVATAYPVAAPPALPAAAASDAAGAAATGTVAAALAPTPAVPMAPAAPAPHAAPLATAKAVAAKRPKPVAHATAAAAAAPSVRYATAAPPPIGGVSAPNRGADSPDGSESAGGAYGDSTGTPAPRPATITPAERPRHRPFNIQIEAAMDRNGATEMVHRLQALGYQPHLVPTQLNGQAWYKIVIGPYPTQEAAAAAQQEMRAKYNGIYGGGGAGSSSRSANPAD